jgi:hypothetical protein
MMRTLSIVVTGLAAAVAAACSGSSGSTGGSPPPATGQACSAATQCYTQLDAAAVHGTVTCLTQGLPSGYCTHTCASDSDCCAIPGECPTGIKEVCAPFESTGQSYCFVACDPSDITATPDAGTTDPNAYCQQWAGSAFTCRSTGGGSANRKFCGP